MLEWNFPKTQGGQIRGIADAGIETFNGKELKSLARETCQNSLDARENEELPVRMEFSKYNINTKDIPGIERYKEILNKSKTYWKSNNIKKAVSFLESSVSNIESQRTTVLRISDFNTKGLSDPYKETLEGWNSLVKLDGGATKSGDSAGSFGIGKNAPFSNSYFRLVFYRTYNNDNEKAAQGVSRLLSYPEDLNQPLSSMANGIGYYGDSSRNMPVNQIEELNKLNERNEHGTDVFVYGFKYANSNWEEELIEATLDNFLVSIYNKQLEVTIQKNDTIKYDTLNDFFEKYKTKAKDAAGEYQVLKSEIDNKKVYQFEQDFHGLGKLVLKVLVDPRQKLNRRILVVRKAGMKLFRIPGISKTICFTGILELQGKALNEYFGSMETPSHDKWEYSRHEENVSEAKQYYEELKEWVSSKIYDIGENIDDGEINVEGLGNILKENQEKLDDSNEENKNESLNNLLGELKVIERKSTVFSGGMLYKKDGETKQTKESPGDLEKDGDPAKRKLKGKRKRKNKTPHRGKVNPKGKDIVITTEFNPKGGAQDIELDDVRIIKTSNNTYIASFVIPESINSGHVEITTIGENGRSSLLNVIKAKALNNVQNIEVVESVMEFKEMNHEGKVRIEFTLSKPYNYAMEVDVYEHI